MISVMGIQFILGKEFKPIQGSKVKSLISSCLLRFLLIKKSKTWWDKNPGPLVYHVSSGLSEFLPRAIGICYFKIKKIPTKYSKFYEKIASHQTIIIGNHKLPWNSYHHISPLDCSLYDWMKCLDRRIHK